MYDMVMLLTADQIVRVALARQVAVHACPEALHTAACPQTELSKAGPMGLLKALLLASQGVEPVEANSDFIAEVDAVAGDALVSWAWYDH